MESKVEENTSEPNFNEEHQNNLAIFEDIKLPFIKYQESQSAVIDMISKIPDLNYDKQKDMDKIEKKIISLQNLYRELNNNYINFINKSIVDIRKNIKLEKKKKKESKDKSKYYVNIPKNAPEFVLKMMNKDPSEKVSQSQVLTAIIQKIKKCTSGSPTTYCIFKESGKIDNTKFKITGELLDFFNDIKEEAKKRGNEIIIQDVMGYPNLMSFMQYFVYKE
tara:strand:- start:2917 stop:3579 length:663 start_codon:yes stop_codon:yes gene_type:complete